MAALIQGFLTNIGLPGLALAVSYWLWHQHNELKSKVERLERRLGDALRLGSVSPSNETQAELFISGDPYGVGRRVRLSLGKKDDVSNENGVVAWQPEMKRYLGSEATIREVIDPSARNGPVKYKISIDGGKYLWVADWMVPMTL